MDAEFAKMQFRALMIQIRYLSENADAEFARIMHRELEREIGVLVPKFRKGNQFLKNRVGDTVSDVVRSRPTG